MTLVTGLYCLWPEDNYAHPDLAGASWSFAGTVDPAYPIANAGNQDPQNPFKTVDTTTSITRNFGATLPVRTLSLIHCNLAPGVTVHFIGAGFNQTAVVSAYQEDGHPTNVHIDLAATFNVSSVQITTSNNGVGTTLGEIVIGAPWRTINFKQGSTLEDETHPNIKNVSAGGGVQTFYEHGYRLRWLRGVFNIKVSDGDEVVRRWRRAAHDDSRPFLIHPHLSIDEPWFVRFEKPNAPKKRMFQTLAQFLDEYPAEFEEAARGLPPEP